MRLLNAFYNQPVDIHMSSNNILPETLFVPETKPSCLKHKEIRFCLSEINPDFLNRTLLQRNRFIIICHPYTYTHCCDQVIENFCVEWHFIPTSCPLERCIISITDNAKSSHRVLKKKSRKCLHQRQMVTLPCIKSDKQNRINFNLKNISMECLVLANPIKQSSKLAINTTTSFTKDGPVRIHLTFRELWHSAFCHASKILHGLSGFAWASVRDRNN